MCLNNNDHDYIKHCCYHMIINHIEETSRGYSLAKKKFSFIPYSHRENNDTIPFHQSYNLHSSH